MIDTKINAILNTDYTLPETVGVYVLFCPETKLTRYGKTLRELLTKHPLNPRYTYYTSYNTFGHFKHHDKDVLGLNAIWLDFDCANYGIPVRIFKSAIPELSALINLPKPNHLIMSGYGFHFVWFFNDPKVTHSPRFTKFWEKLEVTVIKIGQKACKNLFGNPNICDNSVKNPSRLMRVVGSYNHKHGNNILVRRVPEYESRELYSMEYYTEEYMPTYHGHSNAYKNKAKHDFYKYLKHHKEYKSSHNTATLNYGRYYDLKHLVEMRNGKCTGNRDTILFIMACQLSYVMPTTNIIRCIQSVNDLFSEPLPRSQIKNFINEIKHIDFRNYKLHTNRYLIQKLNITLNEQSKLAIIKQARHSTDIQHKINHINRMKYLKHRTIKIKKLHKRGYSYRKIAKQIKISITTISRIINHK